MDQTEKPASPFHGGEQELQRHIGAAERMDAVGRRVIRDHMPEQHRDFFAQLPFILIGAVDPADNVWATLATGDPGFVASPDPKTLRVHAAREGADSAASGMEDGASIGLLGIEFHTRRRNRMNGRLVRCGPEGFAARVEQSFGNCPKYIQLRDLSFARDIPGPPPPAVELDRLDPRARQMVLSADTFFVASYVDLEGGERQVDVSHRGGKPGFVGVGETDRLTIPDFAGNHFFNTLGNIVRNGKAGLLFIDFESGDLLQLTGDAQVILESPQIDAFQGSERLWTFNPRRIVYRAAATSLRWLGREDGLSPFSRATGSWAAAQARGKTGRSPDLAMRSSAGSAQTSADCLDKVPGDAAVPIEFRIEDSDVHSGCPAGGHGGAENGGKLIERQSARHTIVDRRHDGVVQHVGIEVNPEAGEMRL